MKTKANRIAALFEDNGRFFELADGRTLPALCEGAAIEIARDASGLWGKPVRYVFEDGSAITVAGDAWDIGYADCFCWAGIGHSEDCLDVAAAIVREREKSA
jgi:hypothetical protein